MNPENVTDNRRTKGGLCAQKSKKIRINYVGFIFKGRCDEKIGITNLEMIKGSTPQSIIL